MARKLSFPFETPGSLGLNTRDANRIMDTRYSSRAHNLIIDEGGRLRSREGHKKLFVSTLSNVQTLFEYTDIGGNTRLVISTNTTLHLLDVSGTGSLTDVTGTTSFTTGNWKFQSFNGKCIGFQSGRIPIVLDNILDTFDEIVASSGTVPIGAEVLSAFGRLWMLDGQSLVWCDLLDETAWSGGSSGSQPLGNVWPSYDRGLALAEHNGFLVIFGRNNFVIYDKAGTPSLLERVEAIQGIGIIQRDCFVSTSTDLVFLTDRGLVSIARVIQEKSAAISTISPQISNLLLEDIDSSNPFNLKMTFHKKGVVYLKTDFRIFVFDLRREGVAVTTWDTHNNILVYNGEVLLATTSGVSRMEGNKDLVNFDGSGGNTYGFSWQSGWVDYSVDSDVSSSLKFLKGISVSTIGGQNGVVNLNYYKDFKETPTAVNYALPTTAQTYLKHSVPTAGSPRVSRVRLDTVINGDSVELARVDLVHKVGRLT